MDRKSQLGPLPPSFDGLEAVASGVPAKWWRRQMVSVVTPALALLCAVGVAAPGRQADAWADGGAQGAAPPVATAADRGTTSHRATPSHRPTASLQSSASHQSSAPLHS